MYNNSLNLAPLVTSGNYIPTGNDGFPVEIQIGGSTTGITYNQQNGTYGQVGFLVFIEIIIILTSKGTFSGTDIVTINGLPTDMLSFSPFLFQCATFNIASPVYGVGLGTGFSSTAVIYLQKDFVLASDGTQGSNPLTYADLNDNSGIFCTAFYYTTGAND